MHISSISADVLAFFALICAMAAAQMIRLRRSGQDRSGQVVFNGGILLALGLAIACARFPSCRTCPGRHWPRRHPTKRLQLLNFYMPPTSF